MSRKLTTSLIIIFLISLFATSPALAAKSYHAERFNVQIDLQENGSAIVTEAVEFQFAGGEFTYAFREISAVETDGVTFLEASMDGTPMPQGTQAGQVEVEAGNPLKVTWHFSPMSDSAHVFVVRYRADGVIRKDAADTLVWRAIPEEHEYSIAHSTITLIYPPKVKLLEAPTLSRKFESASVANRIILTSSGIGENEDLILTARFPSNSLTQVMPQWQTADAEVVRVLPVGFLAGIATLILGGFGLFTYSRSNKRDLNIGPVVISANPPSNISPAIIGKLTGQYHNFMGAIFDLAQRGVLEVREEKGMWGIKNHMLTRNENLSSLKPHEKGLLEALFNSNETQVNMNEVSTRLGMKSKFFDEPLEYELIQRGWLDPERKQKRATLLIAGFSTMLIALILFIFSLILGGITLANNTGWIGFVAAIAGLSAGMFLLSFPLLIYALTFSVLTPVGEEQSVRWKGFAEYLKQVSKGKESAISPDYFERYLAYAAVFGLGSDWTKYFQQVGGAPLPTWFHAMAGSDGDFGAMVAVMSASDDSAGVGADGGGASGGGSSGAG